MEGFKQIELKQVKEKGVKGVKVRINGGMIGQRGWWTEGETDIVTGGRIDKQDRDGGVPPS